MGCGLTYTYFYLVSNQGVLTFTLLIFILRREGFTYQLLILVVVACKIYLFFTYVTYG